MEARTRGPQAVRYGIFGFELGSVTRDTADAGVNLDADCPSLGGHESFAGARSLALLDVVAHLMVIGADGIVSASMGAAGSVAFRPCRVTTPISRIVA